MHATNQICRNYQHGNCSLGEKCTRKHINADGTVTPTAGPATTSHDSDTNSRPDCWHWTNGKTCPRGDTCHFKHDPEKFGTTSRNRAKSKGDTSSGGGGHNPPSSNGGGGAQTTTSNTGATTSAKCVVCTGKHVFFDACPLKEKVGRILQTAGINYSHTSRWWQNAKNLQAVADWRSKNPKQFLQQARELRFCGVFQAFGTTYQTDIDLGGDFNIAPISDYEIILEKIKRNELTGITPIRKSEVVELANGDHVLIDKWLEAKLEGESINARHVTAYGTQFGFAQAWPGRLIVGRHTADKFGFKDAQKQWIDARMGPVPSTTTTAPIENTPVGIPDIDDTKHMTKPQRIPMTNVTATGTAYVGDFAYKHTDASH